MMVIFIDYLMVNIIYIKLGLEIKIIISYDIRILG